MPINQAAYEELSARCGKSITLVAVSKTRKAEALMDLYNLGQRDFGENYVQELLEKATHLPKDIRWHFIGHLQTNKAKQICGIVHLIHGVDSFRLLKEIDRQAQKIPRIVDCLLQVHIAKEETKFGLNDQELKEIFEHPEFQTLTHIRVSGLMGMSSLTGDRRVITEEFTHLRSLFDQYRARTAANWQLFVLSMGMSNDYTIALDQGTTMIRIGSLLFGELGSVGSRIP